MSEDFTHDVFLSHSSKDKPAVRELAERLRADGLRVWFDEWEIQPGDSIPAKIEQGLEGSRTLVLVMSASAFAAEWVTLQRHTVVFRDPTRERRRFVPLRLDDAEISDALKQFAYVDWRGKSEEQYANLLAACRPPASPATAHPREYRLISTAKTFWVQSVALTADGRRALSGSAVNTVQVWDPDTRHSPVILEGHTARVWSVALTADGRRALSASEDNSVRVWDLDTRRCLATLERHGAGVRSVAVTADGRRALSGSDDKTINVWDLKGRRSLVTFEQHSDSVWGIAVTPDGRLALSSSKDGTVCVWDLVRRQCTATLRGHTAGVWSVAVTPDGHRALSGSVDKTVRVWDLDTGQCLATLEGHTNTVFSVAVTPDGRRALSGSDDRTVRVWDLDGLQCMATLEGHTAPVYSVAVTADGRRALSGSQDNTARVWALPAQRRRGAAPLYDATQYTNAKVLLCGESGVGKTGLAIRLTKDRYEVTDSTDAASSTQITSAQAEWATQLKLPNEQGTADTEREIWLWDFAGQADYRLVHQLFMDETALAVLVFNPQSENPFQGLVQWARDLQRAARRPFQKLLVAGRVDRGGLMVSRKGVDRFVKTCGFAGYLETSAKTGRGCAALRMAIADNIRWEQIPWTSSPRVFKRLKEVIIQLKDEGKVLLRMAELRQQVEMKLPDEAFTLDQLRAVVGLLVGPGAVWQLEFGEFVLLQPERINAYAAAVVRSVRAHTDEIGCIPEQRVLDGDLDYQDMERLPGDEEDIVLRAMHQTFVDHGLCLREPSDEGMLLVFPSYYKRERPDPPGHPSVFVTYKFSGPLDEIYATLVVRLHHTKAFDKDQLWRFAADFKTQAGKRLGLEMIKKGEGAAEITVYFEPDIPDDTRVTFIRYVHEHLKGKDPDVVRVRHYVCPHCSEAVEGTRAVEERLKAGRKTIRCQFCDKSIPLMDLIEEKFASDEFRQRVRELEAQARASIDNESKELILIGDAFAIAGEAGQIFRPTPNSDWGIDGEIEFKDYEGKASGSRIYLQLKSGDSHLGTRKKDGAKVFKIKNPHHADYWQQQAYPVMLVIRTSDGRTRWMDVSAYLKEKSKGRKTRVLQIVFDGEPFTALNLLRLRDELIPPPT